MKKSIIALLLGLLFALQGCGSEAEKTAENDAPSRDIAASQQGAAVKKEFLQVYFVPQPATVEADLMAVVTGDVSVPEYNWYLNGAKIEGQVGATLSSANFRKGDVVRVEVTTPSLQGEATAQIANSPPRLVAGSVVCGLNVEINPQATDADGDEIKVRYLWFVNGAESEFTGNKLMSGDVVQGDHVSLQIYLADGEVELPVYQCNEFTAPNAPPRFVSTPPGLFNSLVYSYIVQAIDPEGGAVSYRLQDGPEGMTLDEETGEISWPLSGVDAGEYLISIQARDAENLQATQSYTINLSTRVANEEL